MKHNFMRNKLIRTILSIGLVLVLFMGNLNLLTSQAADVYGKPYTISNILSDYQYFVRGDWTGTGHTVGAIAVGGTANTTSTIGNGGNAPSYINHIENLSFAPCFQDFLSVADGGCNWMYYNSCENNALDVQPGGNAICINDSTSFLNFDTAFTRLINESVNLKDNATCIIPNDLSIGDKTDAYELQQVNIYEPVFLYLYFPDGSHNISIPYEIFQKLNISNIVIDGVSLADVTNDEYVISITGINDSDISLDFNGAQPNSGIIGVRTTGNIGFAQALKSSESSGQICSSGMKFIWNFPDATGTINLDTQSGHIVAPQAHIVENEKCGNFEGNVIADSVDFNGAEAHFYP